MSARDAALAMMQRTGSHEISGVAAIRPSWLRDGVLNRAVQT